jgi:Domain of unknown function (DUF4411)
MPPYLLDSNFFIQAHRIGFPLDVVPSFWGKIKELALESKIISIDKVKNEIYRDGDDLQIWCEENLPNDFFKSSSSVITSYAKIVTWAHSKNQQYTQQAMNTFMDSEEADAWLIAFGYAHGIPIVTYEISSPLSKKSIKIPDVCLPFGVRTLIPIEMFRELGVRI